MRALTAAIALMICLGCEPVGHALEEEVDLLPPVFQGIAAAGPNAITVRFDEPVTVPADEVRIEPPLTVRAVDHAGADHKAGGSDRADAGGSGEGQSAAAVMVITAQAFEAGKRYTVHATARDARGNVTTFVAGFWGFNPHPPGLVINEFTPRGSKRRRDAIELYVTAPGNLGGVTLYDGVAGDYRDHVVLPPVDVAAGDYIIIHATTDGLGEDEVDGPDTSSHQQAVAGAWDFWLAEGGGLSGNNGVITVYAAPDGELIDGVIYSNRTSDSDERYRGFGSKATMQRADTLAALGGWQFAGDLVAPEDAISSDKTTSTRSLCRDSSATDTDSAADWHTVPTRGATLGAANNDAVHEG
jgi:hypothetical protein